MHKIIKYLCIYLYFLLEILKESKETRRSNYTRKDRENYSDPDIRTKAYPKFQEKLEVCRNEILFRLDYSDIFSEDVTSREIRSYY